MRLLPNNFFICSMSAEWRDKPATEEQKTKLRFFQCTWDEGITAGQAADALAECAKQWPGAEAEFQKSLPATEEQKKKLLFFQCEWDGDITFGQAGDALTECASRWPDGEAAWQKHNALLQSKPVPPKLESIPPPVETAKSSEAATTPPQARHEGFFSGDAPTKSEPYESTNEWADWIALQERLKERREKLARESPIQKTEATTSSAARHESLKNARIEPEPETPTYLDYPPEPRHQDFDAGLSYVIANTEWIAKVRKIEAENRRRHESYYAAFKLWNARFNWNGIREPAPYPKPPLPYNDSLQEVTIQQASTRQNTNPSDFIIPARDVQDYAQRQAVVRRPSSYQIISPIERFEKWLDILLKRNQTCMGGHWLPVGPMSHIFDSSAITIGLCREIAELIESKGYCVEPEPRFGNGTYDRNQTLALFKPLNGDSIQPSKAYLGTANLLRLCVMISAADGQIETAELDSFRPAIESQADLTPTDHKRLIVLEQLLAQELCSASKAVARIAKSISPHNRLRVGKLLVDVAAANNYVTRDERRVLERVFREFAIPSNILESLILEACPLPQGSAYNGDVSPSNTMQWNYWRTSHPGVIIDETTLAGKKWNLNDWKALNARWLARFEQLEAREDAPGKPQKLGSVQARLELFEQGDKRKGAAGKTLQQTPNRIPDHKPQEFQLDMEKVAVITSETQKVIAILSVVMEDEPENGIKLPLNAVVPTPATATNPKTDEATLKSIKYEGLDPKFEPVLERLLTRDSWTADEFNALAREFHFMPSKISDTLNEWSDEMLGDFILDEEDPVIVRRELITKKEI